uniref:C3H1-type domain-containing protein n=1 Tax=Glossina palpalis gambiensis TaxID=67801 RepID=A0A1B0B783_9MUSC
MSATHNIDDNKVEINDEDLEDGEIDDSDEDRNNDSNDVMIVSDDHQQQTSKSHIEPLTKIAIANANVGSNANDTVVTIDLLSDNASTPPPASSSASAGVNKTKKPIPLDDDYAGSIENALANALKKKGIEPTLPKLLENRLQQQIGDGDDTPPPGQGQSRSSRRRKRKKQREEKGREKEKDRKEKKKRFDSPESQRQAPLPPLGHLDDEDDMDDYEMLNVRGGSPPLMATLPPPSNVHLYRDPYNSEEESEGSSYDSFDSEGEDSNNEKRRRRHQKKESRKRRERRNRDDDRRQEKRTRRESLDEKHRNEPRKLELCKFYLMECCAKKDKCSYMHADFPCKYYYLGMDCVYKEECKFAHGKPLSEELRNILLKHLETAPKEILGNFKRISRENALSMITKRHEELCVKFNMQNVWAPITANCLPIHNNRRNNKSNGNDLQQQQQQPQQQLLGQQQQALPNTSNIPSLLDMVIKPPTNMETSRTITTTASSSNGSSTSSPSSNDKQRKSRWADNSTSATVSSSLNIQPPSSTAPSYLDLENLNGILSKEHIEKLSQLGIVNLEQVNQLTFGQLNQIGLTIAEISEIQLNAMNMAKLGVKTTSSSTAVTAIPNNSQTKVQIAETTAGGNAGSNINTPSTSINGDVDMRFLPNVTVNNEPQQATSTLTNITPTANASLAPLEKDVTLSSNSNSNSSSAVIMVDYSQYLKDSNLAFDRADIYDDEKDEEQLVIDDGNLEHDDQIQQQQQQQHHHQQPQNASSVNQEQEEAKNMGMSFGSKVQQLPDILSKSLRNPFGANAANFYEGSKLESSYGDSSDLPFANEHDEISYYVARGNRSSRDSRSPSRTPPARSQSNTPEASQSPKPFDQMHLESREIVYERASMYDYSARIAEEDEARAEQRLKGDKDMRYLPSTDTSSGDIDLRLPFQPITNYTPATEIDASITSHLPMSYKVYEVDIPRASYMELRNQFKSDHTPDPRLRRILGLPELSQTKTTAALSRKVRKSSHSSSIASPESESSSPKYYTPPPTSTQTTSYQDERSKTTQQTSRGDPRRDPRRNPHNNDSNTTPNLPHSSGGQKQNVEIRNLLQKSEWYKNLNSKFKIMVNQQLALVSTELKKFHQDPSPNKIFDISFIVNNSTLQQILTNLGIYIDDNGEVAYVDNDGDEASTPSSSSASVVINTPNAAAGSNINLPNLSHPPPNTTNVTPAVSVNNPALEFLRAPPPNMIPAGPPPIALGPMFQRPPLQVSLFGRPSLLGLPPPAHFNPFASNLADINVANNANFIGPTAAGILGAFAGLQQQQQRNFNNPRNRSQTRRNNMI